MRNSLNKSPIVRAAALAFGLSIAGATPFAAEAGPLRAGGFHFAHPMSFHHFGGPAMNRFHNRFGFRDNRFFGHRHDGLFLGGGWGWYPGPLGYDTTPAYFNGNDASASIAAPAVASAAGVDTTEHGDCVIHKVLYDKAGQFTGSTTIQACR
jgi:hypothetical protein